MGTFHHLHRSVILYSWDNDKQSELLDSFFNSIPENLTDYITKTKLINGLLSIQFIPSGSKAGWNEYDTMNNLWIEFRNMINDNFEFPAYVDLQYGGDAGITYINDTSDQMISTASDLTLQEKDNYKVMEPIHNLISKIYNENPELFLKYKEDIEMIIHESGMKSLKSNHTITLDSYWMQ